MEKLLGFLMPFVVDFINKKFSIDNSKVKFSITIGLSFIIAGLFHLQELQFGDVDEFYKTAGVLFGESQLIYKMWFEKSQMRKKILKAL